MSGFGWRKLCFLVFLDLFALTGPRALIESSARTSAAAEEKSSPAVRVANIEAFWRDPGDISSLNLTYGQGGKAHAPRLTASYTFEKEDLGGTSTKFYVRDQDGVQWLVKVGDEARPETAATRFVWAMGYFTDEDYFVPSLHVSGMIKLHRKSKSIRKDGTVTDARLERTQKGQKKLDNWEWLDNPFRGTKELNGLRVLMALINNWDLKTVNNKIYGPKKFKTRENETSKEESSNGKENSEGDRKEGARQGAAADLDPCDVRYVVSDLGASFGRTGAYFSRSKGKVKDFARDRFIGDTTPETVDFVMRTKPGGIILRFDRRYSQERLKMAAVAQNIPRADAKWIGMRLARLTPEQIRSAFLAAGFTPGEVDGYTKVLTERIAELNAL